MALLLLSGAKGFCDGYGFEEAGRYYGISPDLLQAISVVESNQQINAINHNQNNSIDVCHMQINSLWAKKLGDGWYRLFDPEYCTMAGAWVLKQCIQRYGYNWDAVACYNTGRSRKDAASEKLRNRAEIYIKKVQTALLELKGSVQ